MGGALVVIVIVLLSGNISFKWRGVWWGIYVFPSKTTFSLLNYILVHVIKDMDVNEHERLSKIIRQRH